MNAFLPCWHISRKKLGLLSDLLDHTCIYRFRKRINAHLRLLPEFDTPELRFRNVDADVNLILLEKCGDGRVRRDDVSRTDIENLDDGRRGCDDLPLPEPRLVVSIGGFRKIDIFRPIAPSKFVESGLGLAVV